MTTQQSSAIKVTTKRKKLRQKSKPKKSRNPYLESFKESKIGSNKTSFFNNKASQKRKKTCEIFNLVTQTPTSGKSKSQWQRNAWIYCFWPFWVIFTCVGWMSV